MTPQQQEFVKQVRATCLKNYERGGNVIIECYTDAEIVEEFESLADVKDFCRLRLEQATNMRWGENGDPECEHLHAFDRWED